MVAAVSGGVGRSLRWLRERRVQYMIGVSRNGYTLVLALLMMPSLFLGVWLDRRLGADWVTVLVGVTWLAAVVVSIVVATRDDAREGTGRWYGKDGVFETRSWDAFFRAGKPRDDTPTDPEK